MGFSSLRQLATRLLFMAAFHVLLSQGQGAVTSNVCLTPNSTACSQQRLSCPGESDVIVLLGAREGFQDLEGVTDPQGCQSDPCTETCCRPSSFPCTRATSGEQFALLYRDCWGRPFCSPDLALRPADNDSNSGPDCNGTMGLSSISYQCMQDSSFRAFWNNDTVEGKTVVAQFSRYLQGWEPTQNCRSPSNTLQCDVTSDVGAVDVTVMLIMHHSFTRPQSCSALQFRAGNVTSPEHPCQDPLEHLSQTVQLPSNGSLSLVFSVLDQVLPFQAWALVQAETSNLTMTCGLGTCSMERDGSLTPISSSTTLAGSTLIPCSCPSNNARRGIAEDALYFSIVIALGVLCIFLMVTQAVTLLLLVRRRRAAHDQIYALEKEYSQEADQDQTGSRAATSDPEVSRGQADLDDVSLTEEWPSSVTRVTTKL